MAALGADFIRKENFRQTGIARLYESQPHETILFNIFRDYLSTQEQKEKIIKMQAVERQKNERKKIEQYHSDLFANKQINRDIKEAHIALIEYKGNMFKKIFNRIRQFFRV